MATALSRRWLHNPPSRRRRRNPRKLTLAQRLAGFGGKRSKSAARAVRKPASRRRHAARSRAVSRRAPVSSVPRRRRRRNPGHLYTLGALASNPIRKRKKRGTKAMARKRRRRTNAVHRQRSRPRRRNTTVYVAAPRRRRRNPARAVGRRRRRRSFRRNPSVRTAGLMGLFQTATFTIIGAVGTRAATQAILGSANQGAIGYAANGGVALALGFLASKFLGRASGAAVTVGGFVGLVLRIVQEQTDIGKLVSLQLSGLSSIGDYHYSSGRGLRGYEPMDFFTPLASAAPAGNPMSPASQPPAMLTSAVSSALAARGSNGVAGLAGRSRFSGARVWGG